MSESNLRFDPSEAPKPSNGFPFEFSTFVDGGAPPLSEQAVRDEIARQSYKRAVKAGRALRVASGIWLRGGDEVKVEHFLLDGDAQSAWRYLRHAIDVLGIVRELSDEQLERNRRQHPSPGRDRFRVNPQRFGSVIGRERTLDRGEWVCADDFVEVPFQAAQPALPARLDPQTGRVLPAQDALSERPAISGEQRMRELIRAGVVIDTHAPERAKTA